MPHDPKHSSDAALIRQAEEPDNAAMTNLGSEDRAEARFELERRGYSPGEINEIMTGDYEGGGSCGGGF